MANYLSAFQPFDYGRAVQKGNQLAQGTMKTRQQANKLNKQQAVSEAAKQYEDTEKQANYLRKQGYPVAANELVRQQQKARGGELNLGIKEYKRLAQEASMVSDQQSYDQFRQRIADEGLINPERMPEEYSPEVQQRLNEIAGKKQDLETMEVYSEELGRNVIVPESQAVGMSPAREQQEGLDVKSQFGAIDEQGNRMTVLRTNRGLYRQNVDDQGRMQMVPVDSSQIRPVDTKETGTSDELSGIGKTEQRKLRDQETSAKNFVTTTRDALNLLKDTPDLNTWAARAKSAVNSLAQEAKALGVGGTKLKDSEKSPLSPDAWSDEYKDLGIQSDRLRSTIQSLAYSLARSREGGRLSESDIRSAIRTVGTSADPQSLSATMQDTAERVARRFKINYETRTGKSYQGDLGLESLPDVLGQNSQSQQQGGGQSAAPQGLPEGAQQIGQTPDGNPVYETPDGQRLVVE